MTQKRPTEFFIAGGTLRPDAPSYIERQADQELYDAALRGEFCYVLTSRQMGKSSLMARTAKRLKVQGVHTAIIDLTQIGGEQTTTIIGEWYYGILHQILRSLGIKADLQIWWNERKQVSPVQRLTECFHDLILQQTQEPIVIFIDEIDSTINLPFTDDFFAAIRACHNARATNDAYQRLTFVLLGVATPSQLVKDQTRTPFNVGHRIDLTDFSWEEAKPLAQGLGQDATQSEAMLQRVLEWTGGHPYLTQKLCHFLEKESGETLGIDDVDRMVMRHFLSPESSKGEYNLKFVRDRLTSAPDKARGLLQLYRDILKGKAIADNPLSPIQTNLKLSGLVLPKTGGTLMVRNNIYRQVFSETWVQEALPRDRVKWAVVSTAAACLVAFLVWYQIFLPKPYIQQLQKAREDVPTEAYESLRTIPGFAGEAIDLFASYWDRRATIAARSWKDRDQAILSKIYALLLHDLPERRRDLISLVGKDYPLLQATLRHVRAVNKAVFSPDGQFILTASDDTTGMVWRADGTTQPKILKGHKDKVIQAAFSPNGQLVATGSFDGTVMVWRADGTGPLVIRKNYTNHLGGVAFLQGGKSIITYAWGGKGLRVWRADGEGEPIILSAEPRIIDSKTKTTISSRFFWAFDVSPDGKRIVAGTNLDSLVIWDLDQLENPPLDLGRVFELSWGHTPRFSPDGRKILDRRWFGSFSILPADGKGQPVEFNYSPRINALNFSPDGQWVVTASDDGTARVWRADGTGEPVVLKGHTDTVNKAAFSPDGQWVVTASDDGTARVWRADGTGEPVVLKGHTKKVTEAAFSPDGQWVVTASDDGTARVWRADGLGNSLAHNKPMSSPLGAQHMEDDLKKLLGTWEQKLDMKFNAKGKFVPGSHVSELTSIYSIYRQNCDWDEPC